MSYSQDAEESREWDRFWGSGKVEDYLRYKNCRQDGKGSKKEGTYCGNESRKFLEDRERFT